MTPLSFDTLRVGQRGWRDWLWGELWTHPLAVAMRLRAEQRIRRRTSRSSDWLHHRQDTSVREER